MANRFGYDSKELQEEHGLNWHDYGWRNYDAAIGRFMNPDPHADRYYMHRPYAYAFNSPVLVIDPHWCEIVSRTPRLALVLLRVPSAKP